MNRFITKSDMETRTLANELTQKIGSGVIALTGPLGAGKTTFVQGFAKALGIKDKIISPTFVLIRQHPIPKTKKMLYHIDLYRLGEDQFQELGLEELFSDKNAIVLIEWAEKIKDLIPKNASWISFEMLSQNKRKITLS